MSNTTRSTRQQTLGTQIARATKALNGALKALRELPPGEDHPDHAEDLGQLADALREAQADLAALTRGA